MNRETLSYPPRGEDRRLSEMDGAILRSLDRILGQLVHDTWSDLASTLDLDNQSPPGYSGIQPLGSPELEPFLRKPGLFMVIGPLPEVRVLHMGASRTAIGGSLSSKLIPGPEWTWSWRWETLPHPVPTYAACVSMEGSLTLVPAMKTLLARYLLPLQSAYQGPGEQEVFV